MLLLQTDTDSVPLKFAIDRPYTVIIGNEETISEDAFNIFTNVSKRTEGAECVIYSKPYISDISVQWTGLLSR